MSKYVRVVDYGGGSKYYQIGDGNSYNTHPVDSFKVTEISAGKSIKDKTITGSSAVQVIVGSAINITINGGYQYIVGNGTALNTVLKHGGKQRLRANSGTVVSGTKVYSGCRQSLYASAGSSYKTVLYSNGSQRARHGTCAIGTIISGGTQELLPGSVASNTEIKANGQQICSNLFGYEYSLMGGGYTSIKNTIVSSGGKMIIADQRCTASKALILRGGSIEICSGGKAVSLTMNSGAKLSLAGNATVTGKTNLNGVALSVSSVGNKLGSVTTNNSTKVNYKLSGVAAKTTTPMLKLASNTTQNGQYTVSVKQTQGIGVYELSENLKQANGKSYTLKLGSTQIGTLKLNSGSSTVNGVTYSLRKSGTKINLNLAMKAGAMKRGNAKDNTLTGTQHSDIFYGGKGNDQLNGVNGRDVAVYDSTAWGKDTITKTSGTMTLLFKDLTAKDITKSLSNGKMTITKKNDTSQKITVNGWANATHNIVYASGMTNFNAYLKAASPTSTQQTKARTEVWKKAGLASA